MMCKKFQKAEAVLLPPPPPKERGKVIPVSKQHAMKACRGSGGEWLASYFYHSIPEGRVTDTQRLFGNGGKEKSYCSAHSQSL
jgi:hypothetical protein